MMIMFLLKNVLLRCFISFRCYQTKLTVFLGAKEVGRVTLKGSKQDLLEATLPFLGKPLNQQNQLRLEGHRQRQATKQPTSTPS